MGSISVIVATHDRPALLLDAIGSAVCQTRSPLEVIIVDDGSNPPVGADALRETFGPIVRTVRNDMCQGLAWARRQGVDEAIGDYVVHLDDDDLYAPELLASCARLLDDDPLLDLVFIGVRGFGKLAAHFNGVHAAGVDKVIAQGGGVGKGDCVYEFGDRLIEALLEGVPMPFQRVMARRDIWQKVRHLRLGSYRRAFELASESDAKDLIRGTLRDSEWALYAAFVCAKVALIDKPLYLQRCDGQGQSSRRSMRHTHIQQMIEIKSIMNKVGASTPEIQAHAGRIRANLARAHFDAAYELMQEGLHRVALSHLGRALALKPRPRHFKLFAQIVMIGMRDRGRGRAEIR